MELIKLCTLQVHTRLRNKPVTLKKCPFLNSELLKEVSNGIIKILTVVSFVEVRKNGSRAWVCVLYTGLCALWLEIIIHQTSLNYKVSIRAVSLTFCCGE